jgi:hypothetical protein
MGSPAPGSANDVVAGSADSDAGTRGLQIGMSGGRSRNKGARVERAIVHALQAWGFTAARVPLSGAAGGRFSGDVLVPVQGRDLCVDVKARADGFRELYRWLDKRDLLVVKADRREPLVVVRLSLAAEIAKGNCRCAGTKNFATSVSEDKETPTPPQAPLLR